MMSFKYIHMSYAVCVCCILSTRCCTLYMLYDTVCIMFYVMQYILQMMCCICICICTVYVYVYVYLYLYVYVYVYAALSHADVEAASSTAPRLFYLYMCGLSTHSVLCGGVGVGVWGCGVGVWGCGGGV